MDRWNLIIKWLTAAGSSTTTYLFGGWDTLLNVLFFFVFIDYILGMIASGIRGELNSKIGMLGIARKLFIFVMVAIAHKIDYLLGDMHFIRDMIIFFYLANEFLSIVENGGRLNAPIPLVVRKAVKVLRGKTGHDE
jgi:toxin secretion/phage lysis holin